MGEEVGEGARDRNREKRGFQGKRVKAKDDDEEDDGDW